MKEENTRCWPAHVVAVLFATGAAAQNRDRNAYFGDLHVHTKLSFDAYIFNVRATPDDAYRYAKGESIHHAAGYDVRLTDAPLDFLAVTDHSEYLGILPAMNDPKHPLSKIPYAPDLFSTDREKINAAFQRIGTSLRTGQYLPELKDPDTSRSAWRTIVESADRHYVPGKFTTFRGYEFTSAPDGQNLHRNVIFAGARAPDLPFTALESQNPEELWRWMDQQRKQGIEALAIPHNSNGSDGRMFQRTQFDGRPMDRSYAELRMRNEPLAEITQVKGTSETHPSLSPNDEWSAFEIMDTYIGSATKVTKFAGGYVRDALKAGLEYRAVAGLQSVPLRFRRRERHAQRRRSVRGEPLLQQSRHHRRQAGAARFRAARRPHVGELRAAEQRRALPDLGRIGPDRRVGGGEYARIDLRGACAARKRSRPPARACACASSPATNSRTASRIGATWCRRATRTACRWAPTCCSEARARRSFLRGRCAIRTPAGCNACRSSKAGSKDGKAQERVFDVACSDGLTPDSNTHRCADNGATVDLRTCAVSENKGAVELRALWSDPTFDPRQRAFYYVRVLENPSCRWSTWDAMRAGVEPNPKLAKTIQERAWSSPIWYVPQR